MTDQPAVASTTAPTREYMQNADPRISGVDQSRLNWVLGAVLTVFVAWAPIPLGGNRPIFWMANAIAIGAIGICYALALMLKRTTPRLPLARLWPETAGLALFIVYAAFQVVPIGVLVPLHFALPGGQSLDGLRLSLTPGDSWLALIGVSTYGLFTLLMMQAAANRRRARTILVALFAIVAAHALFALVNLHYLGDTVLGMTKSQYEGFATGTFVNRNSLATFLAAGLSIGVALLFDLMRRDREPGEPSRWLTVPALAIGIVFVAGALLATGSRMGAFAGAIGVAVVAVLGIVTAGPRWGRALGVALVLGVALAGAFLAYGAGTLDRLVTLEVEDDGRWLIFEQVIAAIQLRPWFGYGGGSFITAFPAFQHPPLSGSVVWNKAHNTYLALWFEYGVIFGSIPILIVLGLFVRSVVGLFSESSRPLALAAAGVAVTFAVHSVVDFSLEIQANVFLMLAVLALGAAHTRVTGRTRVQG